MKIRLFIVLIIVTYLLTIALFCVREMRYKMMYEGKVESVMGLFEGIDESLFNNFIYRNEIIEISDETMDALNKKIRINSFYMIYYKVDELGIIKDVELRKEPGPYK